MVVLNMKMVCLKCPEETRVLFVANDISNKDGSFDTYEDDVSNVATEYEFWREDQVM